MMSIEQTSVQFYNGEELICELPMTSEPCLDMAFKYDDKHWKVCKVTKVKGKFECQVNQIDELGKIIIPKKGES